MSSTDPQKAPGSGAGDPASTQKIPRTNQQGKQGGKGDKTAAKTPAKSSSRPTSSGASPATRPTNAKPSGDKAPAEDSSSKDSSSANASGKDAGAKDAGAKDAGAKKASGAPQASGAAATGSAAASSSKSTTSTSKSAASASRTSTPGGTAKKGASGSSSTTGRGKSKQSEAPMTARDYARTTREASDTTSVIPAVRESGGSSSGSSGAATMTSAVEEAASGRRARLRLVHVEPWSVTRLAFVVSVALMIVAVVGVVIFWVVLDLAGVWDSLNGSIVNVLSDGEGTFDLTDYLGLGRLVGLTLLLSAINVIVMTMMATIAAHLYNLSAQLLGGISLTFSDK